MSPANIFHLTDHLGNVRAVIKPGSNNEAVVVQSNDYYPFGMVHSTAPATNLYLYNGKEAQKEMTGKWLDYGARFYDAQLGRWHVKDLLADNAPGWSPYRYGFNNPLIHTDPTGMFENFYYDEWQYNNATNVLTWQSDLGGSETHFVNFGTPHKNGGMLWKGTAVIDFSEVNIESFNGGFNDLNSAFSKSLTHHINTAAGQGGGLGTASTIFGAVGVAGDVTSMSNSTFRIMSGANGTFSPKIYNSGWNGGSPARITTYSLSKVGTGVSTGASVVTTYMSYNQIYNGEAQPITYVDAGVGTAGILAAGASYFYGVQIPVVGEFVAVYGALRLTWDVSFYLGTQYGPSKWYGTNDNKWFK